MRDSCKWWRWLTKFSHTKVWLFFGIFLWPLCFYFEILCVLPLLEIPLLAKGFKSLNINRNVRASSLVGDFCCMTLSNSLSPHFLSSLYTTLFSNWRICWGFFLYLYISIKTEHHWILDFWLDKTQHLQMSPWALGFGDGNSHIFKILVWKKICIYSNEKEKSHFDGTHGLK